MTSYVLFSPLGEKNHAIKDATTMKMRPMIKLQLWKKDMRQLLSWTLFDGRWSGGGQQDQS